MRNPVDDAELRAGLAPHRLGARHRSECEGSVQELAARSADLDGSGDSLSFRRRTTPRVASVASPRTTTSADRYRDEAVTWTDTIGSRATATVERSSRATPGGVLAPRVATTLGCVGLVRRIDMEVPVPTLTRGLTRDAAHQDPRWVQARSWGLLVSIALLTLGCAGDEASSRGDELRVDPDEAFWLDPPQIYWGDLHTHSINSVDVYTMRSPILGGDARDADVLCEFARTCAQVDFWALTDHMTGSPPLHWRENLDAARACQTRSDETGGPVVFLGFEWQQSSADLSENYAHKNVILRSLDRVPARAFTPANQVAEFDEADIRLVTSLASEVDPDHTELYDDLRETVLAGLATPICEVDVPSPELPDECTEAVHDPATVFQKLDEWDVDALVIPHGNTWGQHHDPGMSWAPNLVPEQRDSSRQRLVEIYSGHGSIEEWRAWTAADLTVDPADPAACPEPTTDYLPCCWQAGEIVRARIDACSDTGEESACEAAVEEARAEYLRAGRFGINTIAGVEPEAWLDCGECRDCFQPTQQYRPGGSVQAALTSAWLEDADPLWWHWGFVATTDSHAIGPGSGYKDLRELSDIFGSAAPEFDPLVDVAAPQIFPEWRRQNSTYRGGGLTGVHAPSGDRDDLFSAMENRATFATTGDRIDLYFDLERSDGEAVSMGGVAEAAEAASFVVRTRGAPEQGPGCAEDIVAQAPEGFIENICFGECYNPTARRLGIERVELVRLLPRLSADESTADLIADPLAVHSCEGASVCTARLEDDEWRTLDRPALYYVRVVQEATPQLNPNGYRCVWNDAGVCTSVTLCKGGYRGDGDDCLEEGNEQAWSSPIMLLR